MYLFFHFRNLSFVLDFHFSDCFLKCFLHVLMFKSLNMMFGFIVLGLIPLFKSVDYVFHHIWEVFFDNSPSYLFSAMLSLSYTSVNLMIEIWLFGYYITKPLYSQLFYSLFLFCFSHLINYIPLSHTLSSVISTLVLSLSGTRFSLFAITFFSVQILFWFIFVTWKF